MPYPTRRRSKWLGNSVCVCENRGDVVQRGAALIVMSVYESAFSLETGASDERVERAAEVLTDGAGIVVFDGFLALRRAGRQLLCEVIDPTPSAHRCANEYEVLVENARRALEASKLAARSTLGLVKNTL